MDYSTEQEQRGCERAGERQNGTGHQNTSAHDGCSTVTELRHRYARKKTTSITARLEETSKIENVTCNCGPTYLIAMWPVLVFMIPPHSNWYAGSVWVTGYNTQGIVDLGNTVSEEATDVDPHKPWEGVVMAVLSDVDLRGWDAITSAQFLDPKGDIRRRWDSKRWH